MRVSVILGTAREGRQSEKAARYMLERATEAGFEAELLDVRDFRVDATTKEGQAARRYSDKIQMADALIIVAPEYNHGYPGELKMMLDMAYAEYSGKPAGICGVSSGAMGGARAVEQLRLVLAALGMVQIPLSLYFSYVENLFDGEGKIRDVSYNERAARFLEQIKGAIR